MEYDCIINKTYTETCQKYSVTVIFYYIFHVKTHFLKTLFQSRLLFDFDDFFTNKNRIKCSFERQKYNTMIVHLKTNNLSLCLNHEHLKSVLPKNILK